MACCYAVCYASSSENTTHALSQVAAVRGGETEAGDAVVVPSSVSEPFSATVAPRGADDSAGQARACSAQGLHSLKRFLSCVTLTDRGGLICPHSRGRGSILES